MLRAALVLLLAAPPALAQGIEVRDAYAFSPRPGAPTGAAYMVIANAGGADRLLSASSPAARHVVLHDSVEEGGVVRMEEARAGIEVPAGGELALVRGGAHLMFMGITDPFEDGATVPIVLSFERAGEVAVEVPVDQSRLAGPAAAPAAP